jgi:hypothetical protein
LNTFTRTISHSNCHPNKAPDWVEATRCDAPTAAEAITIPGPIARHRLIRCVLSMGYSSEVLVLFYIVFYCQGAHNAHSAA